VEIIQQMDSVDDFCCCGDDMPLNSQAFQGWKRMQRLTADQVGRDISGLLG